MVRNSKAFLLRSAPRIVSVVSEALLGAIKKKERKGLQIGKEKVKPSVFADHMIVHVENLREFTKKTSWN